MNYLSSFIAIIGPPNVGKSTLLNRILGEKLAIVSPKPQTTRNRIIGIYHGNGFQIVFMDTPGIHTTRTALHKSMVASARTACREVDMVLLMIEIGHPDDPEIPSLIKNLKKLRKSCILAINKIDMHPKEWLLPVIDSYRGMYDFQAIVPISAPKGDGVDKLIDELRLTLKSGPQYFPEEIKTDQSEIALVSEIIREKVYHHTSKELPYSTAVTVDEMKEVPSKNLLSIIARVHVERDSQKAILIGKGGRMIKAIGRSARREIQKMFAMRTYLDLTVTVAKNWTTDTRALRRLGY